MLLALAVLPVIWIVDQNNGPGTNFTDLPPPVAIAAPGDTILIRSGSYSAVGIDKSLVLRGDGAASTFVHRINILGPLVGVGPRVDLSGITVQPGAASGVVAFGTGEVNLTDCVVRFGLNSSFMNVTAARSEFHGGDYYDTGGPGLSIGGGPGFPVHLVAHDCSFRGGQGMLGGGPGNPTSHVRGDPGLSVVAADVQLTACDCFGADMFPGTPTFTTESGDVVRVAGGAQVRLAGDAATTVQAGGGGVDIEGLAIHVDPVSSGSAIVHGAVTLVPASPGGPTITPGVTLGAPEFSSLGFAGTVLPSGELDSTQPMMVTFDGLLPFAPTSSCSAIGRTSTSPWSRCCSAGSRSS